MNMSIPLTGIRSYIAAEFSTLRARALRTMFWAKLIGRKTGLARFPEGTFQMGRNRKLLGIQDIPVEQVIGTLYRYGDFDHHFRPLKKNLEDRWVNIYLLHHGEGWPPILVHKVGDHYYVEDGHHRVSVARALGIVFIRATIWEYPDHSQPIKKCVPVACNGRTSARKYAPATD